MLNIRIKALFLLSIWVRYPSSIPRGARGYHPKLNLRLRTFVAGADWGVICLLKAGKQPGDVVLVGWAAELLRSECLATSAGLVQGDSV
jgi:hypothetical protein